jgi:WD40 repeat protein
MTITALTNDPAIPSGHTSYVNCMLRINANQVATVSDDRLMLVWNINTSSLVNTYYGHLDKIQGVTVLPSGYLASYGNDAVIRVWDLQNALVVSVATTAIPGVGYDMKWSAANGLFVVNMVNNLAMFNPTTYALTNSVNTAKTFYGVDILQPSGKLIAVGMSVLIIYNLPTFTVSYTQATPPSLTRVELLPDNVTAVLGCSTGQLMVFNTNTNTMGSTYTAHTATKWVLMLVVTPDGLYVISGAQDSNIIMWTWGLMSLTQVKSSASAAVFNYGVLLSGGYSGSKRS